MTDLTPTQQDAIDQGSINAANANNIKAGIVSAPTLPSSINSANMSSNPAFIVPPAPTPSNLTGTVANGSATIAGNTPLLITPNSTTVDANGNPITPAPTTTPSTLDSIKSYLASFTAPPKASDQYNTDYNASGIDAKQTDFNTKQQALLDAQAELGGVNSKLQGINAEATAIPIQDQQNAEGRGITAAGLAPITTGELRMNALKAIPLQAQALVAQAKVAAAQGNATLSQSILQQAQDHLDKVFQIHQTDATNAYNYQNSLIDKAYTFATAQEQKQLDAQKTQLATNQSNLADARNFAQSLSTTATANGQGQIASQLASLTPPDINSKTFASDLATYNSKVGALQKQIVPKSTTATETWSSPYNLGNKSVQRNNTTGEIRAIGDANTTNGIPYTSEYKTPYDYVNKVLSTQGVSYANIEANTPKGFVYAIDNQTGQTGLLDAVDWKKDGSKYTPMYNNL